MRVRGRIAHRVLAPRHTELYHEFLEMTEAKIEAFLATKGYDPSAFYKLCRQVQPSGGTHTLRPCLGTRLL